MGVRKLSAGRGVVTILCLIRESGSDGGGGKGREVEVMIGASREVDVLPKLEFALLLLLRFRLGLKLCFVMRRLDRVDEHQLSTHFS